MTALANLTYGERQEYDEAGARDREWFACRPGREYRLRPATPAERKVYAHKGPVTHVLVRKFHDRCRMRSPVHWSIPGDLPDEDMVLGRLAAGAVFTGGGGHA
jgi:hypothetical protein